MDGGHAPSVIVPPTSLLSFLFFACTCWNRKNNRAFTIRNASPTISHLLGSAVNSGKRQTRSRAACTTSLLPECCAFSNGTWSPCWQGCIASEEFADGSAQGGLEAFAVQGSLDRV